MLRPKTISPRLLFSILVEYKPIHVLEFRLPTLLNFELFCKYKVVNKTVMLKIIKNQLIEIDMYSWLSISETLLKWNPFVFDYPSLLFSSDQWNLPMTETILSAPEENNL